MGLSFTERVAEQVRTHMMHFSSSASSLRKKVSCLKGKKAVFELLPRWPGGLSVRKRFSGGWLRRFEPGSTRRFTDRVG
eukprot:scaffold12452_cov49-Phaeocystis_antarctica.AAC.1